jgi:hypothetical protein
VVGAATFHERSKLILSGICHSDVAKVLNRISDTSAIVEIVLAQLEYLMDAEDEPLRAAP